MLNRKCPKCGSTKVIVSVIIKTKDGPITKEITIDLKNPANIDVLEVKKIIKCAKCSTLFNESWPIPED